MTKSAKTAPRLPAFFLAAILFSSLATPVFAELKISTTVGFGGFYRPGAWTPITVLIDNKPDTAKSAPSTLKATLTVIADPDEGDETRYTRKIEITHYQRALVTIYAKISDSRKCKIELRRGRKLIWSRSLKDDLTALNQFDRLMVAAIDSGTYVTPRTSFPQRTLKRAYVLPERLPDKWHGYESVDLLVLTKDITKNLALEGRRDALIQWVRLGGRALIIGGIESLSYQESFLDPILPVTISGSRELEFHNPGSAEPIGMAGAEFELKAGAKTLLSHKGRPIAARWAVGAGEVSFVGVDLDAPAAGKIPILRALWDTMVSAPGQGLSLSSPENLVFSGVDFGYGRAARLPNIIFVILALVCYAVLVGPVNFYILGKRRRLELAWITIPTIVLAFSATIYMVGLSMKGGMLIVREIDVVKASAGTRQAKQEKLLSIFSPKKQSYTLTIDSPQSAMCSVWNWQSRSFWSPSQFNPIMTQNTGSVSSAGWPLIVDQTAGPMRIPKRLMSQWSTQNFCAETMIDLGGTFDAKAVYRQNALEIAVANNTAITLRKCLILVGDSARQIGDMPPGATHSLTFPLQSKSNPELDEIVETREKSGRRRKKQSRSSSIYSALDPSILKQIKASAVDTDLEDDDTEVAAYLRGKAWNSYFDALTGYPPSPKTPLRPKLIGWLDAALAPAATGTVPDRYAYGGMAVVDLPLTLATEAFSVDGSYCAVAVADVDEGETGYFTQHSDGSFELDSCSAVFHCSPGFRGRGITLNGASVSLQLKDTERQSIEFYVFDFQETRWKSLNYDNDTSQDNSFSAQLSARNGNPIDGSIFLRAATTRKKSWNFQSKSLKVMKIEVKFGGRAS